MTIYYRRNTCRLCGENDLELAFSLAPTPIADNYMTADRLTEAQEKYPLDLFLCRSCGHLELHDVIAPEAIYSDYLYETSTSLGLQEHFLRYTDEVLGRVNIYKGSVIADLGCNDGTLLRCFQNKGMRVFGVEPSQHIAQKVRESGIEVYSDYFSHDLACKIRKEQGTLNMVTANNMLANIDDLDDYAKGIREILASDGVFIFETGYAVDLIQNTVIDNIYHEHLSYFRIKPLANFFNRHGMELIDVERKPPKGGSLRCTVQLSDGSRVVSPSVIEWIALEDSLGFGEADIYKECSKKIETIKNQLLKMLSEFRSQGKTIAAYGAAHGTTTLLYYFEIGEMIDYIFDDNRLKHGKFSPGYHIPVFPSREIYEKHPDYIVILAWRYAAPIVSKHSKYLEEDGKFIIPLPRIKII